MRHATNHQRLFPLSGIAFVALIVSSLAVGGDTPDSGASVAEVGAFYDGDLARQYVSTFLLAAAAPFAVLFGVGLASAVGDGARARWGEIVRAGAILVAGAVLLAAGIHIAVVDGGDSGISETALQALNTLDGSTWIAMTSAVGILLLGSAGAMLSSGSQRVLGWCALVLGLALFLPFLDLVAIIPTALWIVVASIVVARGREREETAVDGIAVPTGA
jgi:hypothetical protein